MSNGDGRTIKIEVTGYSLTVGKLKWKPYKRLKSQVVESLACDGAALMSAIQFGADGDFGGIARIIADCVADLDLIYATGCLVDPPTGFDIESLDFDQISQIVAAAQSLNPISEIVEHEKNSPSGGLIQGLFKAISLPGLTGVGGSLLSQFLPASTDGHAVS